MTCSKKQFIEIDSTENILSFSVEDIQDAEVNILVYSERQPSSVRLADKEDTWQYIEAKHIVKINLKYKETGIKTIKVVK